MQGLPERRNFVQIGNVMKTIIASALLAPILWLAACAGDPAANAEATKNKIFNPNGDSELALLMRDMFDDCMAMKEAIERDEAPTFSHDPQAIFTAHATEPDKAASPEYHALGKAYLAAARAYESAAPEERKAYFQGLVHTCMACHEQLCPGPTRKIKRLYWEGM
jgi:hypothetical protein